jgi:flagellar biosynthetic protein FliQ
MSSDFALMLTNDMLWTAIMISAPILGLSMLVGLAVSLIQVVTQVQEMSLTFIPKILTAAFVIIVFGSWMLNSLVTYASTLIANIPQYL